ncbi:hypothetical protein L7F22_006195 [Adiantum nelumboides]|nr:hypothetical protein [Adiantum nelumboides]MCO5552679.1 hypothetical protein [Adiantum nelumboides]
MQQGMIRRTLACQEEIERQSLVWNAYVRDEQRRQLGERTHIDWACWATSPASSFRVWVESSYVDTEIMAKGSGIRRGIDVQMAEIDAAIPEDWHQVLTGRRDMPIHAGWFVKLEDQKRSLISRLMQHLLVHMLFKIPYKDVAILRTKEGKPYVEPCYLNESSPNLNFNVSHHGDYVALASETLCIVGLDIMVADTDEHEAPEDYIKNFQSCFTVLEWNNIKSVGPDPISLLDQFHRYWCMKESYIKAIGIGLGFDLQRAEFFFSDGNVWNDAACLRLDGIERTDWCFHLSHLDEHHWVCVAKGPPADAVESFKKSLHVLDVEGATFASALRGVNSFTQLTIEDLIPHKLESSC